jgi:hypothetical protein
MSQSIYEKVRGRLIFLNDTFESIAFNSTSFPDEYLMDNGIDHLLITYEIDQLKKELPETFKKSLELILNRYISLQERFTEHVILNVDIPNSGFTLIFSCLLDEVIKHLRSLLNTDQKDLRDNQAKLLQLSETLYERAKNRMDSFLTVYCEIGIEDRSVNQIEVIYEKFKNELHPYSYTIQFDQLKKDFPDTYKKYLESFLSGYNLIPTVFSKFSPKERPKESLEYLLYKRLNRCSETIIEHLKELLNSESEIPPQLQTNLTDTQRSTLYDLLVGDGFISESTDRNGFIWAFGGKKDKIEGFKINWLKTKNLAVYLIDQLCFDESKKLQSNYLSIGSQIFGIKNMAQIRNGYKNNDVGVPLNSKTIDEILEKVKEAN